MNRRAAQRGETLTETLLSLAVIAIVISMTTGFFVQMFNHYGKVAADVDAQSEARFAMGRATQALRQAMTDPANPPGPPVGYPTPGSGSTPPQASSVTFYRAISMPSDADYRKITYQQVTIAQGATPPPGHIYPDLVVSTFDMSGNPTGTSIIGRDVKLFSVYPVTSSIYDIQIVTQPGSGLSQGGTVEQPFALNSRVFISYYQ